MIVPEFWECGHELFKSTSATFLAAFIPGDVFDSTLIKPREPFYSEPTAPRPPDLRILKSLTPLQGHVSVVHASSFFHLFEEEEQLKLARQLATLLSPLPGSTIFRMHGGRPAKGFRTEMINSCVSRMFCHSPESWTDLWDGGICRKRSVEVEVKLLEHEPLGSILLGSLCIGWFGLLFAVRIRVRGVFLGYVPWSNDPLHVQRSALQSQLGTRPAGDIGDTNHQLTSEKRCCYLKSLRHCYYVILSHKLALDWLLGPYGFGQSHPVTP